MGATASTEELGSGAAMPSTDGVSTRLIEEFEVGEMLGEGAFGVVYTCIHRRTRQELAVKMVDKVESPIEAIKQEADILKNISHHNIVRFHHVFFEKCFVCIVMDKYGGGDLIDGLHAHMKVRGKIQCHSVSHVSLQMAASVQYLHSRLIVHRDIKGDNYLMDRKDICHPECRIALTDFGTAYTMHVGERLDATLGTKIFWAPEMFQRNYGLKVDIWAMGVTMYGLLDGHFPFKDEGDICKKNKQIKYPKVSRDCEDYLRAMLRREEDERPDADAVMAHRWVAGEGGENEVRSPELPKRENASLGADPDSARAVTPRAECDMKDNVNVGVAERRRELVDRLNQHNDLGANGKKKDSAHYWAQWFTVADKRSGTSTRYEWWDEARVRKSMVLAMDGMAQQVEDASGDLDRSPHGVGQMLKDCGINISRFGTGNAKTLEQLAAEVQSGAARLMLDATNYKKIVRVVDIVLLRLYVSANDGRVLVETGEKYPNGHRRDTFRMPAAKKQPHETSKEVAQRVLKDFLSMGDVGVHFDFDEKETYEEEIDSPSFPGVTTVYRKEIVKGYIKETKVGLLDKIGLPLGASWSAEENNGQLRFLSWMTESEATSKGVKLKAAGSEEVSGLVMAPIGFVEEDLAAILKRGDIDISQYGKATCKSLKEFSEELIRGESSLMQGADGGLARVVDNVFLKLVNPLATEMLVQTEQSRNNGIRQACEGLPSATRRPDENQFLTAKRILRRQLKIDENNVKLNSKTVRYFQEEMMEPDYPGVITVYRKRVISAKLKRGKSH